MACPYSNSLQSTAQNLYKSCLDIGVDKDLLEPHRKVLEGSSSELNKLAATCNQLSALYIQKITPAPIEKMTTISTSPIRLEPTVLKKEATPQERAMIEAEAFLDLNEKLCEQCPHLSEQVKIERSYLSSFQKVVEADLQSITSVVENLEWMYQNKKVPDLADLIKSQHLTNPAYLQRALGIAQSAASPEKERILDRMYLALLPVRKNHTDEELDEQYENKKISPFTQLFQYLCKDTHDYYLYQEIQEEREKIEIEQFFLLFKLIKHHPLPSINQDNTRLKLLVELLDGRPQQVDFVAELIDKGIIDDNKMKSPLFLHQFEKMAFLAALKLKHPEPIIREILKLTSGNNHFEILRREHFQRVCQLGFERELRGFWLLNFLWDMSFKTNQGYSWKPQEKTQASESIEKVLGKEVHLTENQQRRVAYLVQQLESRNILSGDCIEKLKNWIPKEIQESVRKESTLVSFYE